MYTLGADPEFFIEDHNGNLTSIIGRIGGSKHSPKYIDDFQGFAIQEDNVAAEYNIPPAYSKEQFIQYIQWPQQYIAQLLGTDKFRISPKASGQFSAKDLQHPQAQEFGCDPDYNAWTLQINEKPTCNDASFRTCGGHVHIGMPNNPILIVEAIRKMDKVLGVWSVIADKDTERRKLYGKAGAFRPQPHGCEYRTMSNFWIMSEELISEVWDRTQQALHMDTVTEEEGILIQKIINNGLIKDAQNYLRTNGLT